MTVELQYDLKGGLPRYIKNTTLSIPSFAKQVELILKVCDARIPLTSDKPIVQDSIRQKFCITLYNKQNLANDEIIKHWKIFFEKQNKVFFFLNFLEPKDIDLLLNYLKKIFIKKHQKLLDKNIFPPPMRMMVIGLPNTGKSTLINKIIKKSKSKIGSRPGVTKNIEWVILSKKFELLDTPGILPPNIEDPQDALKYCCIHAIEGNTNVIKSAAKYLIETQPLIKKKLQKKYSIIYFDYDRFLTEIRGKGLFLSKNYERDISLFFLTQYRKGKLGKISIEIPPTN